VPHVSHPAFMRLKREHLVPKGRVVHHRVRARRLRSQASRPLNLAATVRQRVVSWAWFGLVLSGLLLSRASGEELVLYGAGSLREVMTQIAADYQETRGLQVRTDFGPSGLMRERIERGEPVDVFASADLGHPLTLQREGRSTVVAMFTRNTLCAMALPRVGLTPTNLLDRLLDPGVKLSTSTPKADPAGDYTWAMFRLADQVKLGSFAILDQKAQQIIGGTLPSVAPSATGGGVDPAVAALREGVVDVVLGYCTSARLRMSQLPELQVVDIPEALRVGPEYGLALVKGARAGAIDLMLYILSLDGQATLKRFGFHPVGLPTPSAP
jgi:molybdate transport system substrate-binding protein